MSTYVLMKFLESAPHRYDLGIRLLTLGYIDKAYDRLISHIQPGAVMLDIGCGTGLLTLRAARRGARVTGIDINPEMLEIARQKVRQAGLETEVNFREMGVAELEKELDEQYDAVLCGLCLSEFSEDELRFTFKQIHRLLKTDGKLLIADEVLPSRFLLRFLSLLIRIPLIIVTYLFTRTTTRALKNLPQTVETYGFRVQDVRTNWLENFMELVALKI